MQTELQPIHIAAVIPPEEGTTKPGTVSLMTTGEKLKYWPGEKIVGLSPGVKGRGRTYVKARQYQGKTYEDTILAEFIADGSSTPAVTPGVTVPAPAPPNGSYGELTSKDRSILFQTAMKAAAEGFQGSQDVDGMCGCVKRFIELHDEMMALIAKRSQ